MTERLDDPQRSDKESVVLATLIECGRLSLRVSAGDGEQVERDLTDAEEELICTALRCARSAGTRIPADVQEVIRKQMVDFGEIPDRTSPDEHPDCYLLTREEIVGAFMRVIEADRATRSASGRSEIEVEESTDSIGDWQCKGYADDWITFPTRKAAERYQESTGALMRYVRFYHHTTTRRAKDV